LSMLRLQVRVLVDGDCRAPLYLYNGYVSFFGEIDPVNGLHRATGEGISGKAFAFKGGRGSTVGSYVIYALKYYGRQPACLVVEEVEPIIVTGCVMADIPLFQVEKGFLSKMASKRGLLIHERGSSYVEIEYE